MRSYRFYFLNRQSLIAGVEYIEAETDADALGIAEVVFRENGTHSSGYEVWDCEGRILHALSDAIPDRAIA